MNKPFRVQVACLGDADLRSLQVKQLAKLKALKYCAGMTKEKAKSFFTAKFVDTFWGKI